MLVVGEHAGSHIAGFSNQFQSEFVSLLSRRFGTKRVRANQVYQEYISDKSHLHMNSTRWVALTEFVKHLGRSGIARVDETEKGWFIAWIDSSPKALAKAEASLKKDRATVSDEQRERQLIAEQISRAAAEDDSETTTSTPPAEEGLKRDENSEKVVLSFTAKPVTSSGSAPIASTGLKMNPLKAINPLKANPLKRPNVFKSSAPTTSDNGEMTVNEKKRSAPMSAAERLIIEEQERKRRRMDRDNLA
jgi:DNA/RNA-binding protein KIN17